MTQTTTALLLLLALSLVAANLPWMTERRFIILPPREGGKSVALRLIEWLLLFFVVLALSLGLEQAITGTIYPQDWEFYVVVLCLFAVFAMPGFIYRHDLKPRLERMRRPATER